MAFIDTIRSIAYAPRGTTASGFLPPLIRAMGHILYLVGCQADENVTVTDEEALTELRHAQEHWNARVVTDAISATTTTTANTISTAFAEAITEWPNWDAAHRTGNIRDLANRIVAFTAALDRELVGLRDSDAGSSL